MNLLASVQQRGITTSPSPPVTVWAKAAGSAHASTRVWNPRSKRSGPGSTKATAPSPRPSSWQRWTAGRCHKWQHHASPQPGGPADRASANFVRLTT
jgi:hypothetical protein